MAFCYAKDKNLPDEMRGSPGLGSIWTWTALTGKIIEAIIRVHQALGPGFLERIYRNALVELRRRDLLVNQEHEIPIYYKGVLVGKHRLDLVTERRIVIELKSN